MPPPEQSAALGARVCILDNELALARSELAQMARVQGEYASILANLPMVIMIMDAERRIRKVSNAALHAMGWTRENVVGQLGGEVLRCAHHLDTTPRSWPWPRGSRFFLPIKTC